MKSEFSEVQYFSIYVVSAIFLQRTKKLNDKKDSQLLLKYSAN